MARIFRPSGVTVGDIITLVAPYDINRYEVGGVLYHTLAAWRVSVRWRGESIAARSVVEIPQNGFFFHTHPGPETAIPLPSPTDLATAEQWPFLDFVVLGKGGACWYNSRGVIAQKKATELLLPRLFILIGEEKK